LPIGACEILDTWYTAGLRGTGSHDWQVTDVFVPEEQSLPVLFDGPSAPGCLSVRDFAAYNGPRVAAVALGIARDAIDAFTALTDRKFKSYFCAVLQVWSSGFRALIPLG
jgi:alkylation response protein AidB-like acyl-CoA dehydrogenase